MESKEVHSYDGIKYTLLSYKVFGALSPTNAFRRKIYYWFMIPLHILFSFYFYGGFYHDAFTKPIEQAGEATSSSFVLSNIMLRAFIFYNYRKNIIKSYPLLDELDKYIKDDDEKEIIRKSIRKCRLLEIIVHVILFSMIGAKIVNVIINYFGDRVSLFPIWVPYDWVSDTLIYSLTMLYQLVAIEIQVVGYAANQLLAPTVICVLIGHIRVLRARLQKIGLDKNKTLDDNHKDLIHCAKMFNIIYRLFQTYAQIITLQMITQFCLSAMVLSMQIVLTIYFTTGNITATIYTGLYVVNTIISELLLSCWYGEKLKIETEELTNAYYATNWMDQTQKFKKDLFMLMQRSQISFNMVAGFMHINLRSFVQILRFAYSASLILRNMKSRNDD